MRRALLMLAALSAAGCGQARHAAAPPAGTGNASAARRDSNHSCSPIVNSRAYRTCFSSGLYTKPAVERRTASGWRLVTGPLRPAEPSAQWYGGWLSPDHRTLLVDWGFPCDSSVAVFVSAVGGTPRPVTGERDWRKAPLSRGVGWTSDGKARVRLYSSWQGHRVDARHPPVLLLFDPHSQPRAANDAHRPGC